MNEVNLKQQVNFFLLLLVKNTDILCGEKDFMLFLDGGGCSLGPHLESVLVQYYKYIFFFHTAWLDGYISQSIRWQCVHYCSKIQNIAILYQVPFTFKDASNNDATTR